MTMPALPSNKQLNQMIAAAYADLMSNKSTAPAPTGAAGLFTDPKFLAAMGAPTGPVSSGTGPTGRQSNTQLPASTTNLERSVNAIGFKPHHQSIFGRVFDLMSRPMYAVAEGARQGLEGDVGGKGLGKTLENVAGGMWHGFEGKQKTDWTRILTEAGQLEHLGKQGLTPDQALKQVNSGQPIKSDMNKWVSVLGGLAGDVAFDPLTYTGVGLATKVKDIGRTAENLQKVMKVRDTLEAAGKPAEVTAKIPKLFLGGDLQEGKWLRNKALPTSAQKADVLRQASDISKAYGHISFNKLFADNRIAAEKELAAQGIRKYKTKAEMQKFLKGDATWRDVLNWNNHIDTQIEQRAGVLSGDRMAHVKAKAGELLDIATHSNLARTDVAKQLDKRVALRFAGKDVAHVKLPEPLVRGVKAAAMSDKVKGIRDPIVATHDLTDRVFRTGSHIEPLVNAMRMAHHSSILEKINNHVRETHSVWGHTDAATRDRVRDAVTNGLTNVNDIKGGKSWITGKPVDNLVGYTNEQLAHLESLIGSHPGAIASVAEVNKTLPKALRIPAEITTNKAGWLADAWKRHFLDPHANAGVQRIGKDPATFLHMMHKAVFTAAADKELDHQIIHRFGHQLLGANKALGKRGADPAVKLLKDKHGYRAPMMRDSSGNMKIIKGYENHVFHPDVARGIEALKTMTAINAKSHDLTTNELYRLFSNATQMFKTVVTKFNPGFHERNLIGEIANGAADGVVNPKWYKQSLQVLRLHGRQALDTGEDFGTRGARIHNALIPDAYKKARIKSIEGGDKVIHKRFYTYIDGKRRVMDGVTADAIWHAYVKNGLKTGWVASEFGKSVEAGAFRKALLKSNDKMQHATENIEDYARLAHFISRIERSHLQSFEHAAEEAATYVRKYHFDYNDFTHAERNIISRAIPFYKWTRKNIPLQMALAVQKPGYLLTQMKALNAISQGNGYRINNKSPVPDAGDILPTWLKDTLAVPVGQGQSGTRYLDAPLPTRDAFKFFGEGPSDTASSLMYMLNPAFKVPAELSAGHQFGGIPINNKAKYAAQLTPYSNFIYNLMNKNNTGKNTNIIQFLAGLGVTENTPARIKSALKQQQAAESTARKKYRTSHGALPVGGRPK